MPRTLQARKAGRGLDKVFKDVKILRGHGVVKERDLNFRESII